MGGSAREKVLLQIEDFDLTIMVKKSHTQGGGTGGTGQSGSHPNLPALEAFNPLVAWSQRCQESAPGALPVGPGPLRGGRLGINGRPRKNLLAGEIQSSIPHLGRKGCGFRYYKRLPIVCQWVAE